MNQAPYSWLKQVEHATTLMQEVPLWGNPPPFPWDAFKQKLAAALDLPRLNLTHHKTSWYTEGTLLEGLGTNPLLFAFDLLPLEGEAIFAMSANDAARLATSLLSSNGAVKGFSDHHLQEGFYGYLLLEALSAAQEIQAFGDLSLSMREKALPPEGGALCMDVQIDAKGQTYWGRVICPEPLCRAFKGHFSAKRPSFSLDAAKGLDLPLRLEVGTTSMKISEWQRLKQGDFLLLDRCNYDPRTHKGSIELVLGTTPLFRARIKEEGIKILDYAFYYEEGIAMNDEEEFSPEDNIEFPEDEAPVWEEEKENQPAETASVEKKISPEQIPLTVTVEVARLNMSLEKLLELKPGNELQLPVRPEQGVDLVINGKKVAKGELVKIGETLGIRILQMGG